METKDIEMPRTNYTSVESTDKAMIINPTYSYANDVEKYQGFLSKQFPTIGNPSPLGLCAFGLTTFVLSLFNAGGLVSIHTNSGVVMGLALFYGGLVLLLSGMWEMRVGNTFGAVAFSSYGAFYMSFAALFINAFGFLNGYYTYANGIRDLYDCLGIYCLAWAIFTLVLIVCAHRSTLLLLSILICIFLIFINLSVYYFALNILEEGATLCKEAAGCFGVILSFLAWYGAIANMCTEKTSFFILPVGYLDSFYVSLGLLSKEKSQVSLHH